MNPKQFLVLGGIVLVVVGVLGFVGITGPTAADSIFGAAWFFDAYENWAHLILGIVALIAAFVFPMMTHKPIVVIVGLVALFFAVYNIFEVAFLGAMLQQYADTVLHAFVAAWALFAAFNKKAGMMSSGM